MKIRVKIRLHKDDDHDERSSSSSTSITGKLFRFDPTDVDIEALALSRASKIFGAADVSLLLGNNYCICLAGSNNFSSDLYQVTDVKEIESDDELVLIKQSTVNNGEETNFNDDESFIQVVTDDDPSLLPACRPIKKEEEDCPIKKEEEEIGDDDGKKDRAKNEDDQSSALILPSGCVVNQLIRSDSMATASAESSLRTRTLSAKAFVGGVGENEAAPACAQIDGFASGRP